MGQTLAFPVGRTAIPISRPEVRRRALQLAGGIREQVKLMDGSCTPRPQPRTLFEDVTKGKPASDETLLAAVVAAAANAHMPEQSLNRFVNWLHVQLLSLRGQRPRADHATLWMHDTEAEGLANIGEQQFEAAVRRGDVLAVERIIEQKSASISAAYRLLQHMVATRDEMTVRA